MDKSIVFCVGTVWTIGVKDVDGDVVRDLLIKTYEKKLSFGLYDKWSFPPPSPKKKKKKKK